MATTVKGGRWRNWSGSVDFKPREVATPRSVDELAQTVAGYARDGRHMRVTGSGHSFTPLVRSDDVLLSMAGLSGITAVDAERGTVTVLGGTPLKKLGDDLLARGLAQENLGDIDVQTITGAVSTGTHGTGSRLRHPLHPDRRPHPRHRRRRRAGAFTGARPRHLQGGAGLARRARRRRLRHAARRPGQAAALPDAARAAGELPREL